VPKNGMGSSRKGYSMETECEHRWSIVASFEERGCQLQECTVCGATRTSWLVDSYVVPVDPMDELGCDSCQ